MPVISDGLEFEQVSTAKILAVTIRQELKWNAHIDNVTAKAAKRLYLLRELKRARVSYNDLVLFYCSAIRLVLEYACMLFHRSLPRYPSEDLERIQKRAMGIIFPDYKYRDALKTANIDTLYDRCEWLSSKLFNEISHTNDPKLASLLPPRAKCRKLKNNGTFDIPTCKTDRYKKSFIISHLELMYFQFFKCRLIFNSFIVFYVGIYLIIFTYRYIYYSNSVFIARNSFERL